MSIRSAITGGYDSACIRGASGINPFRGPLARYWQAAVSVKLSNRGWNIDRVAEEVLRRYPA